MRERTRTLGLQILATGVSASNAAVRSLLPSACASCGERLEQPLGGPICDRCWSAVPRITPPLCACCGDALPSALAIGQCARCRARPPSFDVARSAGRYDGTLRLIVHAFKYDRRRMLARRLAALMLEAGADVLRDADVVVPVPLSWRRSLDRGFNQADDLARHLGLPVRRVLRRTRHGPPQAGLTASARHANVNGACALGRLGLAARKVPWRLLPESIPRRLGASLSGLTVVLVDDVMTTGATMEACGRIVKDAGAVSVRALTVARTMATLPRQGSIDRRPDVGGDVIR